MPVLNAIIEFVAVSSYRFGGRMKLTPLLGGVDHTNRTAHTLTHDKNSNDDDN